MAGWFEATADALTFLGFFSAFPRFGDLGATEPLGGVIVLSPLQFTVPVDAPVGTVVGTVSVSGGSGTYTFSLASDALGYFTMVGNQLQVSSAAMSIGTDNILIQATGSTGDVVQLPTTVIITPVGYQPTYYLYGF